MKRFKATGTLLKALVIAGLLAACKNDETATPRSPDLTQYGNQAAKINPMLRLVNDNGISLEYLDSGKFSGKIAKAKANNYTIEYTYDDNNPAGHLWITRKLFSKPGNQLIEHYKYQVVNGVCVSGQDVKNSHSYQYLYDGQNLLKEVKIGSNETHTYSYGFYLATNSFRLKKVTEVVKNGAKVESSREFTISYSSTPDQYPMNPQLSPFNGIDKYLAIYGKFSDALPKNVHETVLTPKGDILQYNNDYNYTLDIEGYVISKTREYTDAGYGNPITYTYSFGYSTNW